MRWLRNHLWLLAVLAIASFVMLWRLDAQPIVNFDEGIHGEVSWEMLAPRSSFRSFRAKEGSPTRPAKLQRSGEGEVWVERGDWLSLSYMNGPYFRKPPLKIWMTAGLMAVLTTPRRNLADSEAGGQASGSPSSLEDSGSRFAREGENLTTWALRLPSAIAGILTIVLTAWWVWEWARSRWAALLAGVIIATSPAIFEHAFRTGEMDGVLTFFVTAALYCWWKAMQNAERKMQNAKLRSGIVQNSDKKNLNLSFSIYHLSFWLLLCGAATGLAVMTKSAAGLLPLPIIALDYLLHRRWRTIRFRSFLLFTFAFLLLAAPWHAAMTLLHGAAFWNEYLGFHVVRRITEQLHNAGAGPLWYFGAMWRIFSPWVWWLIAAVGASLLHVYTATRHTPSKDSTPSPFLTIVRNGDGRVHDARPDTLVLCLVWIATVLGTYTAARTKFAWYLLPMLPACAMLIAWFSSIILSPTDRRPKKRMYSLLYGRTKMSTLLRQVTFVLVIVTVAIAGTRTYTRLATSYQPSPFPAVAAALRNARADGLVAYGFAWQEQPAGYFVLRTSLPQVKLSDGLTDAARTDAKLSERDRAWLITKATESRRPDQYVGGRDPDTVSSGLPEELRTTVGVPHHIDGWLLWPRTAPR